MCDFGQLADEVRRLEAGGAIAIHLDVMDGHFVPNLTYGLPIVEAVRKATELPIDAHLMISEPEKYAGQFVEAGADVVTIHQEATDEPAAVLESIRSAGAAAGIAINPPTPIAAIADCLPLCDLVLVMSVMPGFGGQAFDERALGKLEELRATVPPEVLLEIDGGVNDTTIRRCAAAGGDLFVVGSAIFNHPDYGRRIGQLAELTHNT